MRRSDSSRSHIQTLYRFTLRPRETQDFTDMCHYHSTSPRSHFTQKLLCTRPTHNGRITLSESKLIITENHQRMESALNSEQEHRAALKRYFAIDVMV
ncbi:hypothetical protein Z042_20250 [Chania multitudinisentens RB-25]|uniref:Uncharacterized protein n=1 Tax=Chania multitudinisentens RB-25 TaxID=1441930 RepID=W0LKK4_9GAMM|nr:hypothetical protein Z042_20250 [Chania multitudinisentens RB-25]